MNGFIISRRDDEATVVPRLDHRTTAPDAESDADRAYYQKLKSACESPEAVKADRLIVVSGGIIPTEAADELLASMLET